MRPPALSLALWSSLILLVFLVNSWSVVESKVQRGQKDDSPKASPASAGKRSSGKRASQEDDEDDRHDRHDRRGHQHQKNNDDEESIEDVDEDKIDDIVDDNDKNLVIIFCKCREAALPGSAGIRFRMAALRATRATADHEDLSEV